MDLKETYNKIAHDYHSEVRTDNWWVKGVDSFTELFRPGEVILDVGCGSGLMARRFLDRGLKVVGFDFSEKMIELAKKESPEGQFSVLDLKDIAKVEGMFDGIFLRAVLLHIPKKEIRTVLEGVVTKLKSGGYVYIGVKAIKPGRGEEEVKSEENYGYPYERFFSYFKIGEMESYLEDLGFEIISSTVTPAGRTEWIQIIGKK